MAQTGQIVLQSWARGKRQVHCSLCPLEHCLLLLVIDFRMDKDFQLCHHHASQFCICISLFQTVVYSLNLIWQSLKQRGSNVL